MLIECIDKQAVVPPSTAATRRVKVMAMRDRRWHDRTHVQTATTESCEITCSNLYSMNIHYIHIQGKPYYMTSCV